MNLSTLALVWGLGILAVNNITLASLAILKNLLGDHWAPPSNIDKPPTSDVNPCP